MRTETGDHFLRALAVTKRREPTKASLRSGRKFQVVGSTVRKSRSSQSRYRKTNGANSVFRQNSAIDTAPRLANNLKIEVLLPPRPHEIHHLHSARRLFGKCWKLLNEFSHDAVLPEEPTPCSIFYLLTRSDYNTENFEPTERLHLENSHLLFIN